MSSVENEGFYFFNFFSEGKVWFLFPLCYRSPKPLPGSIV